MKNKILYISMSFTLIYSCADIEADCNEGEQRIKLWHGNVRIDSIFLDWRNHAHAAIDKNGNKVLFNEGSLSVPPEKGDSFIKNTGTVEYTLIKVDSTYVQKWNCLTRKSIIVDRWKNNR